MRSKRKTFKDIPNEEFIQIVKDHQTIRDIVGALGYSRASGSMGVCVKNRIEELGLDTSHFVRRKTKSQFQPKYSLDEILVEDSKYENISYLKKRILNANLLEYKCAECGNEGFWNGKKLVLQLEHKNGIHNDHRLENLCFLCPNCHSQTSTYSGKNMGKYVKT